MYKHIELIGPFGTAWGIVEKMNAQISMKPTVWNKSTALLVLVITFLC